ncbi:MAG: SprT family zinc-dependent metalloprotease [Schleiferiaceae bacterium]|nr:SprT family zinc-dependent metalloprotease [Schleiferiaceae bacterium]
MSEKARMEKLIFGSRQIDYELTFADRKSLGIRVYPDCSVKVIAPMATSEERIEKKLRKKAPWILRQQYDFLAFHPLTPPRKYVNGETHLYLGRQYKLRVEEADKNEVKLQNGRLFIHKRSDVSAAKLLNTWYKQKAEIHFPELLAKALPLFARYQIQEPPLRIQSMSNRWGSCTPQGKIILNPELIKAPKGSIEYVIIHELCHLVHYNHTRAFYELQESIMPNWRKWKERLEQLLT